MSIDLVAAIERLQDERAQAQARIEAIDVELERVRLVLQGVMGRGVSPAPKRRPSGPYLRKDGSLANRILAALAEKEPLTIQGLTAEVQCSRLTAEKMARQMCGAGQLHRLQLRQTGHPYVYARTVEALHGIDGDRVDVTPNAASEVAATNGRFRADVDRSEDVREGV